MDHSVELQHLLLIVHILLLYDSNIDLPNLNMITIIDESFKNVTSLSIGTLNSLEMIGIGNDCFNAITDNVYVSGLPELISLRIGSNSFYDGTNEILNTIFQVYNCSKLLSIEIGEYSFSKFGGDFKLLFLPSLRNLTIGSIENESNNFMHIPNLSIRSILNFTLF